MLSCDNNIILTNYTEKKKQTNLRNSARGDCWTTNPGNGNTPMIFDDEFVVECVWKNLLNFTFDLVEYKPKNAEHCANLKNTQKISSSLLKKKKSVIKPKKKILLNCHDEPRLLKTFSLIYNYIYIYLIITPYAFLFFAWKLPFPQMRTLMLTIMIPMRKKPWKYTLTVTEYNCPAKILLPLQPGR